MFKGIKLYIVVVVAALLLALLLFGFNIYMQYMYNGLEQRIRSIEGVRSVEIVKDKVSEKIHVGIDKEADLQEIYLKIEEEANKEAPQAEIKIQDTKGKNYDRLKDAFDIISFDIYESMVNGNFLEMRNSIQEKLKSSGINYIIKIDEKNIYLTLLYGDSALYKVINYSQALRGNLND
ncbi:MAG: hypothetical protein QME46_08455 [Thermoanaerobacteraceae bacterium]|nr:hypothetical protein [Thermoanaerobacteraceae bacterium]